MPLSRTLALLTLALAPLACAVATEPDLMDDDGPKAGTTNHAGTSSVAGSGPLVPVGGSGSVGGTSVKAGSSGAAGSLAMGGGISSAGRSSGGGGGTSSAGKGAGGAAGGGAGSGAGGGASGCGALKSWKSGDSTLQIAAGEVIQWMGKRYKATTAIQYPNTECAPDKPVDWCANWFESDGSC